MFQTIVPCFCQVVEASSQATAWWKESWFLWVLTVLVVFVPALMARLIAPALRAVDMSGRMAIVLISLVAGCAIVAQGWPPRLGIDLKGGVILVYEIDSSKQSSEGVDDAIGKIEALLVGQDGRFGTLKRESNERVTVELKTTDKALRDSFLAGVQKIDFGDATVRLAKRNDSEQSLSLGFDVIGQSISIDMDKLVAAVSRRVNPGGQKEVTVRRYGIGQLEVIVPEVDQAEVNLIKRIVSSAGVLEFRIVANGDDPRHKPVIELAMASGGTTIGEAGRPMGRWVRLDTAKISADEESGLVTRIASDKTVEVLVVLDRFNVTGGFLTRSLSSYDANLQPCVNFAFNSAGAALFGTLTGQNLPDPSNRLTSRLGIVLDDVLLSAPTIRSAISGEGQITGSFKQADVDFLVGVLNAGSLPAALYSEPISEQRISPQLGADTIRSGARAMVLAMIVVLFFMLAYYRFSGAVADLAVILNVLLVVALMITVKAAFTLAGLAGLVLSVGMAVDANVLIYERMREEVDRGASLRMSIRNGFQRAFSTIVDSNLTTLITGVVLFAIGTDQLKGFAVTLILGLSLNLFTAVFCARVVFDLAERNRWITQLSMARMFGQTTFQFVSYMRPAIVGSTAFILLGLLASVYRGQGLFDIDFTGGTSVQIAFKPDQGLDVLEVRNAVAELPDVSVSTVTTNEGQSNLRYKIDTSLRNDDQVETLLKEKFPGRLATYSMGFGEITPVLPNAPPAVPGDAVLPEVPEKEKEPQKEPPVDSSSEADKVQDAPSPKEGASLQTFGTLFLGMLAEDELIPENPVVTPEKQESSPTVVTDDVEKVSQVTSSAALDFPEQINWGTLRSNVQDALRAEGVADIPFELATEGMISKTHAYRSWGLSIQADMEVTRRVLERMARTLAETPVYLSANTIGGKVAGNTKVTAVYALLASMLMIVLYVWLRFQNLAFGLAAVVALVHDVLVTVACLALSKFVAPFLGWALVDDFKISLDVVAALLTIVGFSINDTIVIFDRLREIRGKSSLVTGEMIDRAVNQTLSRTILTSGTALLATIILYVFGGTGIHTFAFTMLIGIVTGTYSTVYIASPIVLWLQAKPASPGLQLRARSAST